MERLTIPDIKIDGGTRRTVIDPRKVKEYAMTIYWALKKYEDTDLTPEQIMSLKKRDTAKAPSYQDENFGYFECPNCGMAIYVSDDFESHRFCLNCGQRILWKEDIDGK